MDAKTHLLYNNDYMSPNSFCEKLTAIIIETFDELTPIQSKNFKYRENYFITDEIKSIIKNKNKIYSKLQRAIKQNHSNVNELQIQYKKHKNFCNHLIRDSKKNFYVNSIEENRNNSKKLWKILSKVIETKKSKKSTNKLEIDVNLLNDHFIKSASELTNCFPQNVSQRHREKLSTFSINTMTEELVVKYVMQLKNNKSSGFDGITTKMLKMSIHALKPHITCLFNMIIKNNNFPDFWKISTITPILKSGDKTDPNNYRPISVLSVLSKVCEKHLFNEIKSFLDKNNIINDRQFGFRPKHSTTDCLLAVQNDICNARNRSEYVCALSLDLKKAFDLVNHQKMIDKLNKCGLNGVSQLIESFLSDRKQLIKIGEEESDIKSLNKLSVIQGSTLGPLFFNIFINDVFKLKISGNIYAFADDMTVIISDKNILNLNKKVNKSLKILGEYFKENHLLLNPE